MHVCACREAVRFQGPKLHNSHLPLPAALLIDLDISSSGGDALVVLGGITPLLQKCQLQVSPLRSGM